MNKNCWFLFPILDDLSKDFESQFKNNGDTESFLASPFLKIGLSDYIKSKDSVNDEDIERAFALREEVVNFTYNKERKTFFTKEEAFSLIENLDVISNFRVLKCAISDIYKEDWFYLFVKKLTDVKLEKIYSSYISNTYDKVLKSFEDFKMEFIELCKNNQSYSNFYFRNFDLREISDLFLKYNRNGDYIVNINYLIKLMNFLYEKEPDYFFVNIPNLSIILSYRYLEIKKDNFLMKKLSSDKNILKYGQYIISSIAYNLGMERDFYKLACDNVHKFSFTDFVVKIFEKEILQDETRAFIKGTVYNEKFKIPDLIQFINRNDIILNSIDYNFFSTYIDNISYDHRVLRDIIRFNFENVSEAISIFKLCIDKIKPDHLYDVINTVDRKTLLYLIDSDDLTYTVNMLINKILKDRK